MSSVDVFGRYLLRSKQSTRGPPGIGYKHTTDGHYDIEEKRLCNIGNPVENSDVYLVERILRKSVNKFYVKWLGFNNTHNSWINKTDI